MSTLAALTPVAAQATDRPSGPVSPSGRALPSVQAKQSDVLASTFGVQTHLGYGGTAYQRLDKVKSALTALGVRNVRDQLYGNRPDLYRAIREVASLGIGFNLIMGHPTMPATDTPARLVETLAKEIPRSAVDSLEGANEWNLKGRPDWVDELRNHQKTLWETAKANPKTADIPILAPALGMRSGYQELGDLSQWADYGNAHNYPGGQVPSVFIDAVTAAERLVVPGKPVIFTESGYHNAMNNKGSHPATPESVAGVYAPRLLLEHVLRGTPKLYMYELVDQYADPGKTNQESNFGLLRNDFTPKPAYTSIRKLLALTSDPGPSFTPGRLSYQLGGAPSDTRQILLRRRNGDFQLVLWRDVSIWDRTAQKTLSVKPVDVTVQLGSTSTMVLQKPTTSAAPTAFKGSSARIPLGAEPVVLQISKPATTSAPAARLDGTCSGSVPSAPRKLAATTRAGQVALRWKAPASAGSCERSGYVVTIGGHDPVRLPAYATKLRFVDLAPRTSYRATVRAVSPAGTSAATKVGAVTPASSRS